MVNSYFNLGEPISNLKIVRKILRSLLERFKLEVTTIKESKDIDSMRVDELVSSIQTYEDARYDPNDFLAFIAFMHDSDYDTDSDDEFINEKKVTILNNLIIEYEKLIKNYLKDHDILEAHKTKIDMLNVERTNLLEKKLDFLSLNIIIFLRKIMP